MIWRILFFFLFFEWFLVCFNCTFYAVFTFFFFYLNISKVYFAFVLVWIFTNSRYRIFYCFELYGIIFLIIYLFGFFVCCFCFFSFILKKIYGFYFYTFIHLLFFDPSFACFVNLYFYFFCEPWKRAAIYTKNMSLLWMKKNMNLYFHHFSSVASSFISMPCFDIIFLFSPHTQTFIFSFYLPSCCICTIYFKSIHCTQFLLC